MKKAFLLILVPTLVTGSILAQHQQSITFTVQPQIVHGGKFYVPSTYMHEVSVEADRRVTSGIAFGGAFHYSLSEKILWSGGLNYSHQGQRYFYEGPEQQAGNFTVRSSVKAKVSLQYLQLPIQLHFTPKPEERIAFSAYAGIYIGFLLGYRHEVTETDSYSSGYTNQSTREAHGNRLKETRTGHSNFGSQTDIYYSTLVVQPFRFSDFGATFGAGWQITLSEKFVLPIALQYQIGIKDVKNVAAGYQGAGSYWDYFHVTSGDPNGSAPFHNSSVGISIGLNVAL